MRNSFLQKDRPVLVESPGMNIDHELEASLELEDDYPENPRAWRTGKKVFCSIGPVVGAFVVIVSNPAYVASITAVIQIFQISTTLAISPLAFYALGLGAGPMITAVAEIFGRRYMMICCLTLSLVFTIVSGVANNFRTLAVGRFCAGLTGSPCITVAVGILNDIWDVEQDKLGTLFAVLLVSALCWAIEVGPVIGVAIVEDQENWRWSQWIVAILLGVTILLVLPIPETYKPEILRQRARQRNLPIPPRGQAIEILRIAFGRPVHMLFVEPLIYLTAAIAAIGQVVVVCCYIALPLVYTRSYRFTPYEVGLSFLPLFIGSIIGLPIVAHLDKTKYRREKAKAAEERRPIVAEARLYPAMIGSVLMPISLFWLGWTARPSIHWIVPMLAEVLFGCAFILVVMPVPVYRNDFYGYRYGASALAADNIVRYTVSAAIPLFTVQMIDGLGFGWAMSLLAFISLLLMPVPWVLFRWGSSLKKRSKYLPVEVANPARNAE